VHRQNKAGFEQAVKALQESVSVKVMEKMGLSTGTLAVWFLLLIFILVLMFVFIFLGISGFANTNQFTAVINSLLPIAGALGMSQGSIDE
jgi:hypothetical protein